MEKLQSHLWLTAPLLVYGEIFAHFLTYYEALLHIWFCNCSTLVSLYLRKIRFSFLSVGEDWERERQLANRRERGVWGGAKSESLVLYKSFNTLLHGAHTLYSKHEAKTQSWPMWPVTIRANWSAQIWLAQIPHFLEDYAMHQTLLQT